MADVAPGATGAPQRVLWLLRHAKTVRDPPAGGTDHDRRLAPRGRRDADALGRRLADPADRLGLGRILDGHSLPDLVLCSTATRTVQTAERVFEPVTGAPPTRYLRTLYSAAPEGVLAEVKAVEETLAAVMVVGHNPAISDLAEALVDPEGPDGDRPARGLPTCALAVYWLDAGRWADVELGGARLAALFSPPY